MEPGAARRIRRRQLVAAEVLDDHVGAQPAAVDARVGSRRTVGRARLQECDGALGRCGQLLRQRRDAELVAIAVQHPQHEEIAADERVPRRPSRSVPKTRVTGTGSVTAGMWHAWQLCVLLKSLCSHSWYGTCSGSLPITLPSGPSACVSSVWQVAHSSDSRMCGDCVGR